jgi:hypothetical protein
MITSIYYAKNYCHSWYDPEKNVLVVKVFNLDLGIHRRKAFAANIEAIEKYKIKVMIMDSVGAMGHQDPTDTDWLIYTVFPEYKKQGIRLVVYTFPKNHIAKVGAKAWLDIANKFGFDFLEVTSLEEAYAASKGY